MDSFFYKFLSKSKLLRSVKDKDTNQRVMAEYQPWYSSARTDWIIMFHKSLMGFQQA